MIHTVYCYHRDSRPLRWFLYFQQQRDITSRKVLQLNKLNALASQIYFFEIEFYMFLTEELSETCRVLFQKNKFDKLLHLFGFIIRIHHDARSPERHKCHTNSMLRLIKLQLAA